MASIAGHTFELTSGGRRCVSYSGAKGGTCGATWLFVRSAQETDIDASYAFAHIGKMSRLEYTEIRTEVLREEAAIWEAVIDAASAGSR